MNRYLIEHGSDPELLICTAVDEDDARRQFTAAGNSVEDISECQICLPIREGRIHVPAGALVLSIASKTGDSQAVEMAGMRLASSHSTTSLAVDLFRAAGDPPAQLGDLVAIFD